MDICTAALVFRFFFARIWTRSFSKILVEGRILLLTIDIRIPISVFKKNLKNLHKKCYNSKKKFKISDKMKKSGFYLKKVVLFCNWKFHWENSGRRKLGFSNFGVFFNFKLFWICFKTNRIIFFYLNFLHIFFPEYFCYDFRNEKC